MYRYTIKESVKMTGLTPFTNKEATVVIESCDRKLFVVNGKEIVVGVKNMPIINGKHTTSLNDGKNEVFFVEHLLSALAGNMIDCFRVIVKNGNEIPALDSCAKKYTSLIKKAGKKRIDIKKDNSVKTRYFL